MPTLGASRNRTDHSGWKAARSLYRYVWRTSRSSQIVICLLIAIVTPLPMVILEFQRRIVDDAVGARNVRLLVALGAGYLAVICLRLLLKYLADIIKGRTAETIARDLRLRIMKGTQATRHPRTSDSDDEIVGTAVSMLGAETEDMSGFAGDAFSLPLLTGGTVIWVLGYLMWIEPLITAIALVLYIPQLLVVPATQFTINRLARLRIRQLRNLQPSCRPGVFLERSPAWTNGWASLHRQALSPSYPDLYAQILFAEFGNFLDSLGPIIVLTVGGYLAITGKTRSAHLSFSSQACRRLPTPGISWSPFIERFRILV